MLLNLPPGAFQDGFFFDAVMQVIRHHAAAAVAVGLGAEHAFFFDLAGGGEGVAFDLEDAMVGGEPLDRARLASHLFMGLFVAVDGDMEVGLGPVGERHGAVGDDQIVQEMFFTPLDDSLLEQGLAADTGAAVQKFGFLLERQDAERRGVNVSTV